MTELITDLRMRLPASVDFAALCKSLQPYTGRTLTEPALDQLVWRLAGNIPMLQRYYPVYPWSSQAFPEWVPVQILSVTQSKSRNELGVVVQLKVLAGTPATLQLRKFWSSRYCHIFARAAGFNFRRASDNQPQNMRRVRNPLELALCRFSILVTPETCAGGKLDYRRTELSPSQLEFNRQLMDMRDRLKPEHVCPAGYDREVRCYQCPVGYVRCGAACHKENFILETCPSCHTEQYRDPVQSGTLCVGCAARHRLATR